MLAVARTRVPVACADGQRLPFQDGAFDGALLVGVLEYAQDPVALLREARRVARTRVVVLTLSSHSWLGLLRRAWSWRGHPIFTHVQFRSRARVVALAEEAGARVERVETCLVLPPFIAGRFPRVEESLSRRALACGGMVALALDGSRRGART